ncbi:MAG: TetR/AcrR family transcriptional regulator [Myxococcota bacterium]
MSADDPESGGRERKKALFRQRILEAAREVFFRDGFITANLDEVAQIAGVAKGTLYRYFDNKGELYVAVLSHNGEIFESRMREAALARSSPADQLRSVGRFYFEHWTRNREYFQIFWALDNQAVIGELPPGVVEEVTRLWENCLRILADVIERGVKDGHFAACDPWEVANILWTVANGLIQTEHVAPRRELRRRSLDQVFADMIEIFLRGLA